MSQKEANPGEKNAAGRRWLCSHLVRLSLLTDPQSYQTGLLEEIDSLAAAVAVESPYPVNSRLLIESEGFEARAYVTSCAPRENDFLLELCFDEGYRWRPDRWQPDHLYLPPQKEARKKGATNAPG